MNSWVSRARALLCLLATWFFTTRSEAILFEATSNTAFNSAAPTGALTNSGWQYEGPWQGNFLATPIAPTFFLAAIHVGGSSGDVFQLNGFSYHTVASSDCPNSDLRVWKVAETFPSYAPLYTGSNEVGQLCVVFGRGTQRGDSVTAGSPPRLKGWQWGPGDGAVRWGENIVSTIYTDATLGQFLKPNFDRNGITNECTLSNGDSSGGMFIQDGSTWKLAGIHYAVDGPFSLDGTTNTQFNGAIMDVSGLYIANGVGGWQFFPNQPTDIPTGFYSSRVSEHVTWINSVINFQPGSDMQITNIAPVGANIHISLSTGSNRLYLVQRTSDLATGSWTTVTNNLVGNGGTVIAIDPGATTQPKRFYRVQLLQ
jgi:hypothetical protein